jgi:hypothetical protein
MLTTPPCATREASRSIVDSAECEWVVLSVPVPACIASNIAPASPPRTSPTMILDRFCRSASGIRSEIVNSPTLWAPLDSP